MTVGQPISHRIEHLVSGVRASLAVKIFGPDLERLRQLGKQSEAALRGVPGLVDLALEQQTEIPEITIAPKPTELSAFGLRPGELARFVELAFVGNRVASWWEDERVYDVVAKLPDIYRSDFDLLRSTPVDARGERFTELARWRSSTRPRRPTSSIARTCNDVF